jgi:chlorophyll synthase
MWAYGCGVISSGEALLQNWAPAIGGVLLAGPLLCGSSQAVNDWFDRKVDAINEPQRPIPSGRVPGRQGLYFAIFWSALSIAFAATLGVWVLCAGAVGLLLAWLYSAPPLRLKQSGWWGPGAVGFCYEGLPWFTGAAALTGTLPEVPVLLLALLYSIGAHGIMTLNDFKAVEGDRALGIRSLPATLGVRPAALIACAVMALPQAVVVAALAHWDRPWHAGGVALLLAAQVALMPWLLAKPKERAAPYNGSGVLFFVLGMLLSAFAVRGLPPGTY